MPQRERKTKAVCLVRWSWTGKLASNCPFENSVPKKEIHASGVKTARLGHLISSRPSYPEQDVIDIRTFKATTTMNPM
jgi:hypothetical protein